MALQRKVKNYFFLWVHRVTTCLLLSLASLTLHSKASASKQLKVLKKCLLVRASGAETEGISKKEGSDLRSAAINAYLKLSEGHEIDMEMIPNQLGTIELGNGQTAWFYYDIIRQRYVYSMDKKEFSPLNALPSDSPIRGEYHIMNHPLLDDEGTGRLWQDLENVRAQHPTQFANVKSEYLRGEPIIQLNFHKPGGGYVPIKITLDSDLGPSSMSGLEVVSPIIRQDNVDDFFRYYNEVIDALALSDKISSAAGHIHVEFFSAKRFAELKNGAKFTDQELKQLKSFISIYSRLEADLVKRYKNRPYSGNLKSVSAQKQDALEYLDQYQSLKAFSVQSAYEAKQKGKKYPSILLKNGTLSLEAILRYGTVEHRYWDVTLDPVELRKRILFSSYLTDAIINHTEKFEKLLPNSGQLTVEDIVNALNKIYPKTVRGEGVPIPKDSTYSAK